MKPKEIKKLLDKIIDNIQEDIEECKTKNNFEGYSNYISALGLLKMSAQMAREEILKNIKEETKNDSGENRVSKTL